MGHRHLPFILAVDGGQSSTLCVLGTADGQIISAGRGGPITRPFAPGGVERVRAALTSAIGAALAVQRPPCVAAAYLAMTGGVEAAEHIVPQIVPVDRLLAESDAVAALASGTYGGPGIGLIAGTGVCTVAVAAAGERAWYGGWGSLLGDEGGGYWIGLQALRAAARAEDGRGPRTPLYSQLLQQCGAVDMRAVFARVYATEIDQPLIAALAPLVLAGADAGDPVATAIVDAAAEELALLVEATCTAAAFCEAREQVIVATGGVLRPGNALWQRLAARIGTRLPTFQLIAPQLPPVAGAFVLGLRLAGVELTDTVVGRVATSAAALPGLASKGQSVATQPQDASGTRERNE